MDIAANKFARVLVIDDDPVLRVLVEQYFIQRGSTEVIQAADGLEALEYLKQQGPTFDLIVSDINMPKLDGVELMTCLKDIGYAGPIIIVSGTYDVVITMANELAKVNNLNIAGTIYKPFSAGKLDEIINEI